MGENNFKDLSKYVAGRKIINLRVIEENGYHKLVIEFDDGASMAVFDIGDIDYCEPYTEKRGMSCYCISGGGV